MSIERAADDIARCFLLESELFKRGWQAEWPGEVIGVIGAGAFVAFGDGYEGMLPVRRLRGDWWELNEEETMLVGSQSGMALRLGDPVVVQVERVDAPRGRVDLSPVTLGASMADIARNKQASYRYELLESWEAGLVLQGSEVKSLRDGKAQLKDGYAALRDGEVWLYNVHIAQYPPATTENHEPERPRKLLMHKREIERLIGKTREQGPDAHPDAHVLQGLAREGRDRARQGQGRGRQAARDQGARDEARDGAGYTSLNVRCRCVRSIPTPSSTSSPT